MNKHLETLIDLLAQQAVRAWQSKISELGKIYAKLDKSRRHILFEKANSILGSRK